MVVHIYFWLTCLAQQWREGNYHQFLNKGFSVSSPRAATHAQNGRDTKNTKLPSNVLHSITQWRAQSPEVHSQKVRRNSHCANLRLMRHASRFPTRDFGMAMGCFALFLFPPGVQLSSQVCDLFPRSKVWKSKSRDFSGAQFFPFQNLPIF